MTDATQPVPPHFWRPAKSTGAALLVLAGCVMFMVAIYGTSFRLPYGHADDFLFWSYDSRESIRQHPQFRQYLEIGRYVAALIWHYTARLVLVVQDLGFMRFLAGLFLALAMAQFVLLLRWRGCSWAVALLLPGLVFTLPGIGVNFVWILGFPSAVAWPVSGLAYLLICFADAGRPLPAWRRLACWGAALALLLLCLFTYPFAAVFFLALYVADLLFRSPPRGDGLRFLVPLTAPLVLYAVAAALFFVIHRFVMTPLMRQSFPDFGNFKSQYLSFSLTADPIGQLQFFFNQLSPRALELWDLSAHPATPLVVLGVILAGVIAATWAEGRRGQGRWTSCILIVALILGAAVLSVAPAILAQTPHAGFRIVIGYSAIAAVVLVWSIYLLADKLRPTALARWCGATILSLLFAYAAFSASYHVAKDAAAAVIERDGFRNAIKQWVLSGKPLTHIHVVGPTIAGSIFGESCRGHAEFHCNSVGSTDLYVWMIRSVLVELGVDRKRVRIINVQEVKDPRLMKGTIILTGSSARSAMPKWDYPVLYVRLDHGYAREPLQNLGITAPAAAQASRRGGGLYTEARLFDGSVRPDSFWEVGGGFPVKLEISRAQPIDVHGYRLFAGEEATRMPRRWTLWARSANSADWIVIDRREGEEPWRPNSDRWYPVATPGQYEAVRFEFEDGFNPNILRIYELTWR
jgi:hypothetical protein